MSQYITIRRELLDDIIAHCKEVYPNEACGILAGRGNAIERAYRITNINNSTVTYEMDSREQINVKREIEKEGLKITCIYHSHPASPAYPSQTDIARAYWPGADDVLIYPDVYYVIVGHVNGALETRAFKVYPKQRVEEIKLNIIQ